MCVCVYVVQCACIVSVRVRGCSGMVPRASCNFVINHRLFAPSATRYPGVSGSRTWALSERSLSQMSFATQAPVLGKTIHSPACKNWSSTKKVSSMHSILASSAALDRDISAELSFVHPAHGRSRQRSGRPRRRPSGAFSFFCCYVM